MKSLIEFSQCLLEDLGEGCGVSTSRDGKTVAARIEHEGDAFLTITLPRFAKDFERSLSTGHVADDAFLGFSRTRGLPRFLGGFLQHVFDQTSGALLDEPSIQCIRAIRQFCMAFGKMRLPCTPERERAAMEAFVECELDVARWSQQDHSDELSELTRISDVLYGDLFSALDRKIEAGELVPMHGPGSTADRITGNSKFHIRSWSRRLDAVFPIADWILPSVRHWGYLDGVDIHEPGAEMPVRVISVPKTQTTPRIIALEPHYVQYAQQAVREAVYDFVDRDDILSALIGFEQQEPNRLLAQQGSRLGTLATLDLKEASDRVAKQHVDALLRHHPSSHEAIMASRSTTAAVPGHGIVPLAKFASMGSALCFPMEAMVFLAIVIYAVSIERAQYVTPRFVKSLVGQVRVYGDDIIVPVDCAPEVIRQLEAFGLRVNANKSFLTGRFRESCGGDYYDGEWVTPVRVRTPFPESPKHVDSIVSTISLRNQMYERCYARSVAFLDKILLPLLPVWDKVPVGHESMGRWTYGEVKPRRMCRQLQVPLVKVPALLARQPRDELNGIGALMKYFLRRGDEPLSKDSFMRAGRPVSARITTRWTQI